MKKQKRVLVLFFSLVLGSTAARSQTSETSPARPSIFFVSFDPLGFITMGPSINGEFLLQERDSRVGFGFYSGIRITNLGVTSNLLMAEGDMTFSYSFPIGFRVYPNTKKGTDRFFVGPHVEFGRSNYQGNSKENMRAFGVDVGYKWVFRKRFTLEVSDEIGLIQVRSLPYTETDTYTYSDYWGTHTVTDTYHEPGSDWENLAFVFYMISAKIGFTL